MPSKSELKADAEYINALRKEQRAVQFLEEMIMADDFDGLVIKEIRVKLSNQNDGEIMLVIKGLAQGRKVIAFSSGMGLGEAMRAASERIRNNTMKWRDDLPYAG